MAPSIRPRRVSARSHLRWWLDSGRMRSLTGGVCIKLLTKLRHNQRSPLASMPRFAVGSLRIHPQAAQYRACHGYNLSRVPGLAGRSEDFLYASDNVGDPFFLFEEALPIMSY